MLPDHQHNQRDRTVLASICHENAQPMCCIHHRYTAREIQGISPTVGWVSLILSPESKLTLQQHITGFVTQALNLGASPGAAGGGFYAPCPTRDLVSDAVSPVGPR